MLIIIIKYIFIGFLNFMLYKSFEQETTFWFSKEEAFFQK
jgi:hypothetical protein